MKFLRQLFCNHKDFTLYGKFLPGSEVWRGGSELPYSGVTNTTTFQFKIV